ncbi:MAG: hypothetical protein QOG63_1751 [Thermoleophilaceae bacterium]|nr:hypothetical protein [Thermoleophilaceae bacterium]
MNRTRKTLWSFLLLVVIGGLAAFGAYSAFSDTTSNAGNQFSTGTVAIGNNATSPLYNVTNAPPAAPSPDHCIRIAYSGSLPVTVRAYRSAFSGGSVPNLSDYVNVTITKGTGTQEDCSDFSGSTAVYNSTLTAFGTDWASGLALTNASGSASWGQNDAVTYKFSAQVANNPNAEGLSTGTHSFTWEARSS